MGHRFWVPLQFCLVDTRSAQTVQGGSAGVHRIVLFSLLPTPPGTALFRMLCKNSCCRKGLILQARYWQQQELQYSLWDPQQDH